MRREAHGGFGERSGETDREQSRHRAPGLLSDESASLMWPPRAKTWGRRGRTPIVTVRGRGSGRVSIGGLTCYRPGHRSRLIFRLHVYRGRRNETKGFGRTDYRDLLAAAHQQFGDPLVVVWDNVRTHWMPGLRQYADQHDWLTLVALPAYAPELNPTEI